MMKKKNRHKNVISITGFTETVTRKDGCCFNLIVVDILECLEGLE